MTSIRDIYKQEIDFSVLALQSASFAKLYAPLTVKQHHEHFANQHSSVKANGQLNFNDPRAVQSVSFPLNEQGPMTYTALSGSLQRVY